LVLNCFLTFPFSSVGSFSSSSLSSSQRALFGVEALIAHAHAAFRDFVRAQLLGADESHPVAAVRQTIGALRAAANRGVAEKANKVCVGFVTCAVDSSRVE
jgi:hypothetical protein